MQIDIEGMLNKVMLEELTPEKLEPKLAKAFGEALDTAIRDAMGYNSEFRTRLKESLGEALPNGLVGAGSFADLVGQRVLKVVGEQQDQVMTARIDRELVDLLEPVPQRLKLSELCQLLLQAFDSRDFDHPDSEQPTFILESSDYGYFYFYADKNADTDKSDCELRFSVSKEGKIYALDIGGRNQATSQRYSNVYGADLLAKKLYVTGAVIEVDMPVGEYHDYYYRSEG